MYQYGGQQQQPQFSYQPQQPQSVSQQTGYTGQWGQQQPQQSYGQQQQQQQQQQQPLASQGTGWNQQPATSFQSQPTGGLMAQRTGGFPPMTSFQSQPTGGGFQQQPQQHQQPLTSQVTGWNQQLNSQATGWNQPLTSQTTGWNQQQQIPQTSFQSQPLASQITGGWNQQQQQQQQPALVSQNTGYMPTTSFGFGGDFQQPMQTGGYQQQQPMQKLTAQPTGFISSLNGTQSNVMEIPQIRLSFITARDQERFEQIFRSQVPAGEIAMSSSTAKNILMKSNLTAVQLLNIWELADTNKSGTLMFPEFCIALHLANLARRGESIPRELPLKMKNEVTGFVDALNFDIGMKSNQAETQQVANSFTQPQVQPTSSFMQPQQTGYMQPQQTGYMQPQQTGYMQPQQTGYIQPQRTGLTPLVPQQTAGLIPIRTGQQQTAPVSQFGISNGLQPQPTGYFNKLLGQPTGAPLMAQTTGSAPPMTSFTAQQTGGLMPQMTGLQPMPTGRPGQWGFVSAPTGGLPGLDMMQSHFLPNSQTQTGSLQNFMGGNNANNVTWAITKQEKVIYDNIFRQWDKEHNGYVNGDVAIDVFSKSGLAFADLENIWTLSDGGNKGKLNKDEFAVAMHLIYRRLNGFNIPSELPAELIPPSSKMLENSVDAMKNKLKQQASERNSIANNQSQNGNNGQSSGFSFKNNDDDIQYVSKSRRSRVTNSKTEDAYSNTLSLEDLKRQIHEKKILLAAIDAEDEEKSSDYGKQKTMNEIEMLKTQIKSIQSDLNQKVGAGNIGSIEERSQLSVKLNTSSDKVPKLVDAIASIDEQIKNAKIEMYRLNLEKDNPSGFEIRGTGPNGEITERDRRIAKQKAEVQAKMAKLTGKQAPNFDAYETNESLLNDEILKFSAEAEDQKSVVKDIAVSIKELITDIGSSLNLSNSMTVGYQKWEHKDGVQNQEVKDFIDYLNSTKPVQNKQVTAKPITTNPVAQVPSPVISNGPTPAEERAKKIKEDAQRRMNERLAKLGIKRKPQKTDSPTPVAPVAETAPEPVIEPTHRAQPPPPPPNRNTKPSPSEASDSDSTSEDSEDEELKLLLAKKKQLEERKQKKKLEKEQRIAKLKAEMEALEDNESDDSWDEQPKKSSAKNVQAENTPATANGDHSNNPFASILGNKEEPVVPPAVVKEVPVVVNTGSHNPFSKPPAAPALTSTPTGTPIDASKLQAQREAQMGKNETNDWSDSAEDESEDEMPVGAKQAEIASMLFGGSGNATRSNTFIPPEQEKKERIESDIAKEEKEQETVDDKTPTVTETAPVFPPPMPEPTQVFPPPVPEIESEPIVEEIEEPVTAPPSVPILEAVNLESRLESGNNSEFFDAQSEASSFIASSPEMEPEEEENVPDLPAVAPPPLPEAALPPVPPPPPPMVPPLAPSATGGMPNLSNLLGEISIGTSLKRVSSSEQHIANGAAVGRVID